MNMPGFTADGSLYQRDTRYQLKNAYERFTAERKGEVYPSLVFRGCYQLHDCWGWESYGYYQKLWQFSTCDNRYCSGGYYGLVTDK